MVAIIDLGNHGNMYIGDFRLNLYEKVLFGTFSMAPNLVLMTPVLGMM